MVYKQLNYIRFTENAIKKALGKLPLKKAIGPGKLGNSILKNTAACLAKSNHREQGIFLHLLETTSRYFYLQRRQEKFMFAVTGQ